MILRALSILLPIAVLAACAELPRLDDSIDAAAKDARYPRLASKETVLARADDVQILPEDFTELQAKGEALNARAATLPPERDQTTPQVDTIERTALPPEEDAAMRERIERLKARAEALRQRGTEG
jgi:hypothetical protein